MIPRKASTASARRGFVWRHFRPALCNQACSRSFYVILQTRKECIFVETRCNWIKDFRNHSARETAKRTARPEQARVECNWHARHAPGGIKVRHTKLVARLSPRGPTGTLGENDELAIVGQLDARAIDHGRERLRSGTSIDRHHAPLNGEPAEDWNPLKLPLENEHGIVDQRQKRECFPRRLVLGSNDDRALGNLLPAADFIINARDDAQRATDWRAPMISPRR